MVRLISLLINVPITLIALTGHEFAHGWVSSKLGDPTPRYEGRLTLNPLAHLDPIGTLLMIFTGFGWARPVGINPMYYRDRKKGMALTAIAGPLANFIMAFIGIFLSYLVDIIGSSFGNPLYPVQMFLYMFAFRNLCFMVFNLIPIPPLDGSKVLGIFLPNRVYYNVLQYERYAILLIMLLSLSGAFDMIMSGGVNAMLSLIEKLIELVLSPVVRLFVV